MIDKNCSFAMSVNSSYPFLFLYTLNSICLCAFLLNSYYIKVNIAVHVNLELFICTINVFLSVFIDERLILESM